MSADRSVIRPAITLEEWREWAKTATRNYTDSPPQCRRLVSDATLLAMGRPDINLIPKETT